MVPAILFTLFKEEVTKEQYTSFASYVESV
jgi:hypothetical protein